MAIIRCIVHKPENPALCVKGTEPMNPPNEAIACGVEGCLNRGRVWLNQAEAAAYDKGERYFPLIADGKEVIGRIGVIAFG